MADALRVDFYVVDDASARARLGLACKLAEKAYLAAQSVLIWHTQTDEIKALDEMLWTFRDGSFVPHETVGAAVTGSDVPVLLSALTPPSAHVDLLINLAAEVPDFIARARRVIEIIDGDEERRRAGRARFKVYRERGIQPATHNIQGD